MSLTAAAACLLACALLPCGCKHCHPRHSAAVQPLAACKRQRRALPTPPPTRPLHPAGPACTATLTARRGGHPRRAAPPSLPHAWQRCGCAMQTLSAMNASSLPAPQVGRHCLWALVIGAAGSASSLAPPARPAPQPPPTPMAAALKLVGESFPWGPASALVHTRDSHNSVLGVRQLAASAGAAGSAAVELRARASSSGGGGGQGDACLDDCWWLAPCSAAATGALQAAAAAAAGDAAAEPQHLFALPLESNFSGAQYDPRLVAAAQSGALHWLDSSSSSADGSGGEGCSGSLRPLPRGRWRVLLDAAKGAATAPPDLAACPADFVALSFYKIFGWPTGEALRWACKQGSKLGGLASRPASSSAAGRDRCRRRSPSTVRPLPPCPALTRSPRRSGRAAGATGRAARAAPPLLWRRHRGGVPV